MNATSVGDDTPILTRLVQWKIVAKRAVDSGVDLKGANAPTRSSVNHCTGSESDPPILDLTKPLSRRERRELTKRLRKLKPVRRAQFVHGTSEQQVAINKAVDELRITTGITISRSVSLHLIAGGKSCFEGKWLMGTGTGEIFFCNSTAAILGEKNPY